MSTLVSPTVSSSNSLKFRRTALAFAPALALSLTLACGALVPHAAHAQAYTLSTIATFTGTNGSLPLAGLTLDSSGNLYGTTYQGGGGNNFGTVFKIAAGTSTITTLATFQGGFGGANPYGGVTLDGSGNLYGTTYQGGGNNLGTVFKIAAGTNVLTTLATFTGTANGANPYGTPTLDGSGNLYGTTYQGGASNLGTVFKIAAATNALTTLATFTGTANGQNPFGDVTLDSLGNLYGTTTSGGATNSGTVFKIAVGTNALTTLATFKFSNGSDPNAGVTLDSSGNLYGTTQQGGASNVGTVYKIAAGTSTITTLATFTGAANGANSYGTATLDGSGNLYGTTLSGGASNSGTVFKYSSATGTLATIATFTGAANGANPQASVTLDSSGNLYGTTQAGGANNLGTVFKLTPTAAAAPEPSALLLLAPGALGVLIARKRRNTA